MALAMGKWGCWLAVAVHVVVRGKEAMHNVNGSPFRKAYNIVDPNQFGGIRQRSTEDAGLYLTHLVCTGWARGLKTSVIAVDIAQFFSSINHDALMAILRKQGFLPLVVNFFASYLVGRSTSYT